MTGKGFRVTVEDLETGERTVMEISKGDYVLFAFEPCHLAGTQAYPKSGTHVLTIKDYRPEWEPRTVVDAS